MLQNAVLEFQATLLAVRKRLDEAVIEGENV